DTVKGNILRRTYSIYTFNLIDSATNIQKQNGNLFPTDGAFDSSSENFYFILDSSLSTGTYQLNFYGENSQQANKTNLWEDFIIHVSQ
ncbi:MAG: hypothetical protein ABSG15_00150, partial [FCB group bacterium]